MASSMSGRSGGRPGTECSKTGSVEVIATWALTNVAIRSLASGESGAIFSMVGLPPLLGHRSGLLVGIELCIHEEAVLQVIDAQGRSLRIRYRAEVASDLQPPLVRLL